jgi:hypothetical protein
VSAPVTKKKETKDKGKAIAVDTSSDEDDGVDEIPARSRHPQSVRLTLLQNDRRYFLKIQAKKAKQDRKVAAAVDDPSSAEDELPVSTTVNKKPVPQKPRAPKKPAAPRKTAATRPTVQNGNLTKSTKAQPAGKPERKHRPADYKYETVPEESDDPGPKKNNTIAKLRETVDSHARWCPFVRVNKKLHNVYRSVRGLERMYPDSEGDDDGQEEGPEVESSGSAEAMEPPGNGDDDDNGDDVTEGSSEDDNNAGNEPTKPEKKASQTGAKAATVKAATARKTSKNPAYTLAPPRKQTVAKTSTTAKAPAAATDAHQVDSESGKEDSRSGGEDEQGPAGTDSGEEIGLLDDAVVEQGRKAHEKEKLMTPATNKAAKATNPLPTKGTSGSKRKATDMESDPQRGVKKLESKKLKA